MCAVPLSSHVRQEGRLGWGRVYKRFISPDAFSVVSVPLHFSTSDRDQITRKRTHTATIAAASQPASSSSPSTASSALSACVPSTSLSPTAATTDRTIVVTGSIGTQQPSKVARRLDAASANDADNCAGAATDAGAGATIAVHVMQEDEEGQEEAADDDESDVEALMEGLADKIVRLHALLQQQQQQQQQQQADLQSTSASPSESSSHMLAASDDAQALQREKISQLQRVLHDSIAYVEVFLLRFE